MVGEFGLLELTDFLPNTITQIYGEAASGKTNLCLIAAARVARSGKKVIFIDTEGSFSMPRFRQVAGPDAPELLKSIIIAGPADFDEQKIAISKLDDLMTGKDVGLVVVDSLVPFYRLEMGSDEGAQAANKELSKQLSKLMKIAKKYDVPVVVTNQVYSSFSKDPGAARLASVGGDVLKYWTKVVIQLAKSGRYRTATVIRHQHMPEGIKIRFRITEGGVEHESPVDNPSVEV
jgi:DNA repair protein RadB